MLGQRHFRSGPLDLPVSIRDDGTFKRQRNILQLLGKLFLKFKLPIPGYHWLGGFGGFWVGRWVLGGRAGG